MLEEIMPTEQENVVGGLSSTSADSEIAMECTETRNSIDIGLQCNLVVKACRTVETQTKNDRGLYEVITDEDALDSPTKSLSSVHCSDRVMEEEKYSLSNEEKLTVKMKSLSYLFWRESLLCMRSNWTNCFAADCVHGVKAQSLQHPKELLAAWLL